MMNISPNFFVQKILILRFKLFNFASRIFIFCKNLKKIIVSIKKNKKKISSAFFHLYSTLTQEIKIFFKGIDSFNQQLLYLKVNLTLIIYVY